MDELEAVVRISYHLCWYNPIILRVIVTPRVAQNGYQGNITPAIVREVAQPAKKCE